jgi:hypothetical protein
MSRAWWWLSFSQPTGFLGVVITEGRTLRAALERAHRVGANPGGECYGFPVPTSIGAPPSRFQDRLLDKEMANEASIEWTTTPIVSTEDLEPGDLELGVVVRDDTNEGS